MQLLKYCKFKQVPQVLLWSLLIFLCFLVPGYCRNYLMRATSWGLGVESLWFDVFIAFVSSLNICATLFFCLQLPGILKSIAILGLSSTFLFLQIYWAGEFVFFKATGGVFAPTLKSFQLTFKDMTLFTQSGLSVVSNTHIFVFLATTCGALLLINSLSNRGPRRNTFLPIICVCLTLSLSLSLNISQQILRKEAWSIQEAFEKLWHPPPTPTLLTMRNNPFPINFFIFARGQKAAESHCDVYRDEEGFSEGILSTEHIARPFESRGLSIISIQLESINQDAAFAKYSDTQFVMPYLRKLLYASGVNEENWLFYSATAGGLTSDAEFSSLCALEPSRSVSAFFRMDQFKGACLPAVLKSAGFQTIAAHANHGNMYNRSGAYPILGFSKTYLSQDIQASIPTPEEGQFWPSDEHTLRYILSNLSKGRDELEFLHFVGIQSHGPYPRRQADIPIYPYIENCPSCDREIVSGFANLASKVDKGIEANMRYIAEASTKYDRTYIIYLYGDHAPSLRSDIFGDASTLQKTVQDIQIHDQRVPYVAVTIHQGRIEVLPISPGLLNPTVTNQADTLLILARQLRATNNPRARVLGKFIDEFTQNRRALVPNKPNKALVQSYVTNGVTFKPFTESKYASAEFKKTETALGCRL